MISNSTGMDVFDRSFEPMCYSVNTDGAANFTGRMIKSVPFAERVMQHSFVNNMVSAPMPFLVGI